MPGFEELENPKSNLASEIYGSDRVILGKYYIENRVNITYDEISPHVINALIATEDARFVQHSGIDFRSLLRVIFKTILGGDQSSGGGSTITQQLAKMLFSDKPSNKLERGIQKFKEWIIAVKLEKQYTKREIITMYLNKFDFINNAVGLKSASGIYFSKTPDSLKIEEAAVLVGMAKNPSLYNPLRRYENAFERRNVVLFQMSKYKNPATGQPYISKQEFDSLKQLPITLKYVKDDHNSGLAPYFREQLRQDLLTWCKTHKKPDGSNYNLYKDGLKIYTTIHSKMQQYAEEAMVAQMKGYLQPEFFKHWKGKENAPFSNLGKKEIDDLINITIRRSDRYLSCKRMGMTPFEIEKNFNTPIPMSLFTWNGERDTILSPRDSIKYAKFYLRAAFMAMDPTTGYIKAWVGGINFKHFKYDQVKQGKRQTGSTFKPFVYALAMQEGWSPCYQVPNSPVTIELPDGRVWTPRNSDGKYGGIMSLKEGLATSTNTITAYLIKQFGPAAVINLARSLGVESPLDPVPALALGVCDLSLYEVVGANATFVNKGVWIKPTYLLRIEDKNGNLLEEFIPEKHEALSEEAAYLTLNLMEGVVKYGTGGRLRFRFNLSQPIAGKTGTTQNNSDGWFIGLTPDLAAGAWVGAEDRAIHFRSTQLGQGANTALPIYAIFMQKIAADTSLKIAKGPFEKPAQTLSVEIDCEKYKQEVKDSFNQINFN
jgi:penicillin-binding protein 1A